MSKGRIPNAYRLRVAARSASRRCLYLFVNYEYIVTRIYYIDDLTAADMVFAMILI